MNRNRNKLVRVAGTIIDQIFGIGVTVGSRFFVFIIIRIRTAIRMAVDYNTPVLCFMGMQKSVAVKQKITKMDKYKN